MIAKQSRFINQQSQNVDDISWISSDPVTGTSGGITYLDGNFNVNTQEYEPLGQAIKTENPNPLPDPLPPISVGSADGPEWQCQIDKKYYGGFTGMPIHCQLKVLKDLDNKLTDIYGYSTKEENPHKIGGEPAQPHGNSAGMPVDITPTDKPQAETSDVEFIPATNIPGSGSDDENIIAVVQSERAIDEPIAFNNAENGGDDPPLQWTVIQRRRREADRDQAQFLANVGEDYLNNRPDCVTGLDNLLKKLKEITGLEPIGDGTIRSVLAEYRKIGTGYVTFDPEDIDGTGAGQTYGAIQVDFPNRQKSLKGISPNPALGTHHVGWITDFEANWIAGGATFVHELPHWAYKQGLPVKRYGDRELLKAAQALGFKKTIEGYMKDNPGSDETTAARYLAREAVGQYCPWR